LGEAALTDTIVEDDGEVEFEVVDAGSTRKKNKLVSSDGFSYCIKTYFIAETDGQQHPLALQRRRKGHLCDASLNQCGDSFTRGTARNHLADSLMKKRVIMKILISKYFLLSDGKLSEIFMHLPDESSTTRWLRRSAEMTLICHALGLGQTVELRPRETQTTRTHFT
ncbi:uncharacterized protein LOC128210652, partial [Mya arenaria]|uniref:uncharacterized protein LOC128210652 n=1 Tax=Mya arenaria TaxID=6604 RepID=UPI0022E93D3F